MSTSEGSSRLPRRVRARPLRRIERLSRPRRRQRADEDARDDADERDPDVAGLDEVEALLCEGRERPLTGAEADDEPGAEALRGVVAVDQGGDEKPTAAQPLR